MTSSKDNDKDVESQSMNAALDTYATATLRYLNSCPVYNDDVTRSGHVHDGMVIAANMVAEGAIEGGGVAEDEELQRHSAEVIDRLCKETPVSNMTPSSVSEFKHRCEVIYRQLQGINQERSRESCKAIALKLYNNFRSIVRDTCADTTSRSSIMSERQFEAGAAVVESKFKAIARGPAAQNTVDTVLREQSNADKMFLEQKRRKREEEEEEVQRHARLRYVIGDGAGSQAKEVARSTSGSVTSASSAGVPTHVGTSLQGSLPGATVGSYGSLLHVAPKDDQESIISAVSASTLLVPEREKLARRILVLSCCLGATLGASIAVALCTKFHVPVFASSTVGATSEDTKESSLADKSSYNLALLWIIVGVGLGAALGSSLGSEVGSKMLAREYFDSTAVVPLGTKQDVFYV